MSIKIKLLPQFQKQAVDLLPELVAAGFDFLLEHQQAHYVALKDSHIVINSNQTGTGKTKASLLHLLRKEMQTPDSNTLMIAPTNELIRQHADDVDEFVQEHHLPHLVVRLDASVVTQLVQANKADNWRRGEALYYLLRNPRDPKIAPHLEKLAGHLNEKRPLVLVTNPDLFYYILQGLYRRLDLRNLMVSFIGTFQYVIVDEFHYYNPKQAAAFFYFVALSHQFQFFAENRRFSFLTATPEPEVDNFFRNLEALGIKTTWIPPQPVPPDHLEATMSTTEVQLEFVASDTHLSPIVEERVADIRASTASGRDVAIISRALIDISNCTRCFKPGEYATLTGAVSASLRKEAIKSPLILATPTVDIGYNFSRPGKNRQGLDDLYFVAQYPDEFWQRLGRAGRVVKKAEQSVASTAVCVVSSAIFEKLESLELDGLTLTRDQLKERLETAEAFPKRTYFWDYLANEGFFEIGFGLTNLRSTLTAQSQKIVEDVYQLLQKIYGAQKAPSWKTVQGRIARFQTLRTEVVAIEKGKPEYPPKVVREFAFDIRKRKQYATETEEASETATKDLPDSELNRLMTAIPKIRTLSLGYQKFVQEEHGALAGIFNFREAFSGVPALVYDKIRVFHSDQPVTQYDVLHILKNYEAFIYPGRAQFWAEVERDCPKQFFDHFKREDSAIYLRIDQIRPPKERLRLQFQLEVDDLNAFKKLDTDQIRAFQGIQLGLTVGEFGVRHNVPFAPQVIDLFANQCIPMLVLSDNTRGILYKKIEAAGYFTTELVVSEDHSLHTFQSKALIGTAAYFIARRAFGLRCALERHEGFYIC